MDISGNGRITLSISAPVQPKGNTTNNNGDTAPLSSRVIHFGQLGQSMHNKIGVSLGYFKVYNWCLDINDLTHNNFLAHN